jgi:hypothetical protein
MVRICSDFPGGNIICERIEDAGMQGHGLAAPRLEH